MFDELDFVGEEVKSYLEGKRIKKSVWTRTNFHAFLRSSAYAFSLTLREKEIVLFSALQVVAIGLAYYLWVQILGWIPMEVWDSDIKIFDVLLNLVFLAWSFLCVALAAYPVAVLTGAMGAAHFLRQQGYASTIAACLKLALPNSWKLWMFQTADAWLTVEIILERLPKKDYVARSSERAVAEALYYAWKIGTLAVPAALLTGKGLIDAGKESIALVKHRTADVLALRGGYSAICWVLGIATYIGSIIYFIQLHSLFEAGHKILVFYFWMGVPILIAVALLDLFVRPIFVIASCRLYSDFLKASGRPVELGRLPGKGTSAFVAFLVLCAVLAAVYLYREKLGLVSILRVGT